MAETDTGRKPNIILILVDDMGYSDIGCYGSEIRTPNLNRLAEKGIRFTQMYNCGRCCPTRASLLTGLYPHQAGVGHMVNDYGPEFPGYRGFLSDNCVTIAEALKPAGYKNLMVGKWHVGGEYDRTRPETWNPGAPGFPIPTQRGFDEFYGTSLGAGSYFVPQTLMRDDRIIQAEGRDYYFTDAMSEEAAAMIDRHASSPFFLYVAYSAPHWPLHALPEDIERYRGMYRKGWDAIRTARHEELKGMGLLDSKWDISPRDEEAPPWEDAGHKEWEDHRMAVYAAQIDRMDRGVGTIMEALRRNGIEEDTLVLFLSDNGGCAEPLSNEGWSSRFSRLPTGTDRPMQVGNRPELEPGRRDTFMSYDLPWANASNSPFRRFKHWVHEGGVSTPLIGYWPGTIDGGGITHSPAHVIDLMATCLDLAGVPYPSEHGGHEITPLEGETLVPALRGGDWTRERPIFFEHEGNRAVRDGRWKAVSRYPMDWELYDMVEDRTELHDLAGSNQPKRRELTDCYRGYADRALVVDWETLRRG